MKTCVVTATYGCAPNKVWLYMTNPTLNSWNPTVASAEVDLEGMLAKKSRLFDCAERSNKRVDISLLQRQIDDSVQMCKQAFF